MSILYKDARNVRFVLFRKNWVVSIKLPPTIDTMLNFDGAFEGELHVTPGQSNACTPETEANYRNDGQNIVQLTSNSLV